MNGPKGHIQACEAPHAAAPRSLGVSLIDRTGRFGRERSAWLIREAGMAARAAGVQRGELRVALVGDEEMAAAHLRHCGEPGTTDVITFDLADGSGDELDADLLVCLDEAERQAGVRGIRVEHEVLLYVVHGVMHCLGYDDHDEASAGAMHAAEDRVLSRIGVGPVYGMAEASGRPSDERAG